MAQKYAWGIDIGESAIKAVKVRRSADAVVVQECHTIVCEARGEGARTGDREFRVRSALTELLYQAEVKGAPLAVSLPGRDVFPRFIPLPPVEKKRIPEIVRYEARTQMPFPIEEVVWDYQPVTGMDVPGEEVEVAFFAVKKSTVYSFLTNLRLARMVPDLVEITPLALYNFLTFDRQFDVGTVVIDVGAANTDLVIIDGERYWTRSVAISGNDISRALQEKYQISFEEAENLKRKAASSKQAEKIFGAMRPIVDDLIGEIQRSIGYYKAQARNVRIEKVILLGNSFKLPHLVDYFRKGLDYEVSVLERLERVRVSSSMDSEKFEAELPSYAVALGLAIQAVGLGRVKIDLMPHDVVRERLLRRKIPYAAAVLLLLAMPLGVEYQAASREIANCLEEIGPIEKEIKKYEDALQGEKQAEDLGRLGGDLAMLKHFGDGRSEWARFVDDLNRAVNHLEREPFRLNGIRQVGTSEAMGTGGADSLGRVGAKLPEGFSPDALIIEVVFEKDTQFAPDDLRLIRGYLEEQKDRVLKVLGLEPKPLTEVLDRKERVTTGWSYAFLLSYRARPARAVAEAAPAKAPTKATKAPVKRTLPKRTTKRLDE